MRSLVYTIFATLMGCVPALAADPPRLADATLRAVRMIDAHEGWAVGDDGLILHTIDGGQNWERQASGVRASLRALHFHDAFTGYVVGRETLPLGAGSAGVILYTRDGGVKWLRVSTRALPGLHAIRFLDERNGFIAGMASDLCPSGLFATEDGGATWRAVEGQRVPGWSSIDFLDPQNGVLAGPWGQLMPLRNRQALPPEGDRPGFRNLHAVQLLGRTAWAAGDGGTLLVSDETAGKRWKNVELPLPAPLLRSWDFHALSFAGDFGWVVGQPGSVVLHTWDRGKSWQVQQTGQPLPLYGVHFVDEAHGWAVGEFGTILATSDGGKSWKVQRRGGHRAAVVVLSAQGRETTPLGTIAALGGDEGFLTAVVQVTSADPGSAAPAEGFAADAMHEAVRQAGGAAVQMLWQFPLPQHLAGADPRTLARFWGDSQDEARGLEELDRRLVLALRQWRPEVVLVDDPDPRSASEASASLIALAATRAVRRAANANEFPEQISRFELEPWSVKKLYGRCPSAEGASVVVDLNDPRPRLLGSANDHARAAQSLVADALVPPMPLACYRLIDGFMEGATRHQNLMQDINLEWGGQARREPVEIDEARWERARKAAEARQDLRAVVQQQLEDPARSNRLLAEADRMLSRLPEDQAGEAAYLLGQLYVQSGQWPLAKEMFVLLLDRYPAHRMAPEAGRWLVRYGASSEARRRLELGNFRSTATYQFQKRAADTPGGGLAQVTGSRETVLFRRRAEIAEWYKSALAVGDHLAAYGPLYADEPATMFCLQSARRRLGEFEAARLWYTQFRAQGNAGPWGEAAAAELWLARKNGPPPRPAMTCEPIAKPPFLDGKLDDPCWKDLKPVVLQDAVGKTAATHVTAARLAHDAHYLYLALRCQHPAAGRAQGPARPRQRDEDLSKFDRVSLLLDLDRDYATYFHLQVDQRGCVCEDCWGDRSWNPKWYVAVHAEEDAWQIEAAIPLIELTAEKIAPADVWACNLVRIIPQQGIQAFAAPADVRPRPEGMGLLFFRPREADLLGRR